MRLGIFIAFIGFSVLLSGYGYTGELPSLGETTKEAKIEEAVEEITPEPITDGPLQVKPSELIIPRVTARYNMNKYNDYLADIKEVEQLLREVKVILEDQANSIKNKNQLYGAKTFVLGLHIDILKNKYQNRSEKHYESYKQLMELNSYLRDAEEFRKSIVPINRVIRIIEEAH